MKEKNSNRIPVDFEFPESRTSNWRVRVVRLRQAERSAPLLDNFQSARKSRMQIRLWRKQAGASNSEVR
jgi:hypothetical protein